MAESTKNMTVGAGSASASVTATVTDQMPGVPCPATPGYTYTGMRYVPVFADPPEWSSANTYEPLEIVTHEGNSFTSKTFVPVGIDILDPQYWVLTGNYNAQVEQYRRETAFIRDNALMKTVNVEAMKAAQFKPGDVVETEGFYVAGDGGGAKYLIGDSGTADGYSVISLTNGAFAHLMVSDRVNVKWFGAKIDGATDDTAAFNRASSWLTANAKFATLSSLNAYKAKTAPELFVPYGVMKANGTLICDVSCFNTVFDGTIVDATDNSGLCMKVVESSKSAVPFFNTNRVIRGGSLSRDIMRPSTTTSVGISQEGEQSSRVAYYDMNVNGFYSGYKMSANSYNTYFVHVQFSHCTNGLEIHANTKSGEAIVLDKCLLTSNDIAILADAKDTDIYLSNCSVDFNVKSIVCSVTSIFCSSSHFEWGDDAPYQFELSSRVVFECCEFISHTTTRKDGAFINNGSIMNVAQMPMFTNCFFSNLNYSSFSDKHLNLMGNSSYVYTVMPIKPITGKTAPLNVPQFSKSLNATLAYAANELTITKTAATANAYVPISRYDKSSFVIASLFIKPSIAPDPTKNIVAGMYLMAVDSTGKLSGEIKLGEKNIAQELVEAAASGAPINFNRFMPDTSLGMENAMIVVRFELTNMPDSSSLVISGIDTLQL